MQDAFARVHVSFAEATKHGLGHITRAFGTAPVSAAEGIARVVELQNKIVTNTRLGIPAIVHEECLTGFTTLGATVYPAAIAWAATFDPDLVERMAPQSGRHARRRRPSRAVASPGRGSRLPLGARRGDPRRGSIPGRHAGYRIRAGPGKPGSSPPSSTSPDTPLPEPPVTTRPSRSAPGRSATSSCPHSRWRSATARPLGDELLLRRRRCPRPGRTLLVDRILRDHWGFDGVVVSDYWAVHSSAACTESSTTIGEAGASR